MQRLTYGISLATSYNGKRLAVLWLAIHACTSLAPKPMTVVFGLGKRLHVHMRTTLENDVLRNRQQRPENSFSDQGEFVAMMTLSGGKAPHCDKHQFRDKMTVITWTVFEISLLNFGVLTRMRKMVLSLPHTFVFSCLPRSFWGSIWVLLIIKALSDED